jgi:hypothetical protein
VEGRDGTVDDGLAVVGWVTVADGVDGVVRMTPMIVVVLAGVAPLVSAGSDAAVVGAEVGGAAPRRRAPVAAARSSTRWRG